MSDPEGWGPAFYGNAFYAKGRAYQVKGFALLTSNQLMLDFRHLYMLDTRPGRTGGLRNLDLLIYVDMDDSLDRITFKHTCHRDDYEMLMKISGDLSMVDEGVTVTIRGETFKIALAYGKDEFRFHSREDKQALLNLMSKYEAMLIAERRS